MTSGIVRRVDAHAVSSDLMLGIGAAGGPVFTEAGRLIGLTDEVVDEGGGRRRGDARVLRIGELCDAVASAAEKMKEARPPTSTRLPVEPAATIPDEALEEAARRRVGSLRPYQIASSDFDIAFLTPVVIYGALHPPSPRSRDERAGGTRAAGDGAGDRPAAHRLQQLVGICRRHSSSAVDPRDAEAGRRLLDEGGARRRADTGRRCSGHQALQIRLPANARLLRRRRGRADSPFKLEQRTVDSEAIYEGLYVFDPGALGPSCKSVRLVCIQKGAGKRRRSRRRSEADRADRAGFRTVSSLTATAVTPCGGDSSYLLSASMRPPEW